jgi:hypothetical protein
MKVTSAAQKERGFRDPREPSSSAVLQGSRESLLDEREVGPSAALLALEDAGIGEDREVVRHGRLRQVKKLFRPQAFDSINMQGKPSYARVGLVLLPQ